MREARRILGPHYIIGVSTHNVDQVKKAQEEGASYINLGPMFPTETVKEKHPPVGVDFIRQALPHIRIPFTTMGGINQSNIKEVLEAGACRVAVISAVVGADDITAAARELVEIIQSYKK